MLPVGYKVLQQSKENHLIWQVMTRHSLGKNFLIFCNDIVCFGTETNPSYTVCDPFALPQGIEEFVIMHVDANMVLTKIIIMISYSDVLTIPASIAICPLVCLSYSAYLPYSHVVAQSNICMHQII